MAQTDFEIEIKRLLGDTVSADKLRNALKEIDPNSTCLLTYTQLNHYFEGGDLQKLAELMTPHLDPDSVDKMNQIAEEGKNVSVRTREMNGEAKIVMKASIGNDSSSNGVMRMELEATVPGFTLDQLDAEVLAAGFTYQAKWSRTREEYKVNDIAVCLDKNAGYGYVAEFEKVIQDGSQAESTKKELLEFMESLGFSELPQDRLERMFAHYNEHWPEYYGTEKIFTIS
jgi:predicted adenylyl cyclase CyaB